ncbi:PucR family transcriptional regulator [Pseudonocardia endophytica]|uniref:PucR-like helix-turn-helix protein n=1 Tax=Pseudonocardia endophytica TaxID=401976 RepID=A0A4R1HXL5_PSEEN|nr:PucR family transcriptional regulator [Pseudonocardia endophytica]TCK25855.1 PucR-like helix-turn-helix protein [Pseudonocardia endophytica]
MLLSELVSRPELDLRVLHAGQGLDRSVRWVYTTDLSDPGRYLGGGELVISGMVWRHDPSDSERFVAAVARSGAVALAAGEAVFGLVPDDVVEACRRHDLTLLAVPVAVSFGAVTEAVVGAITAARGDRLAYTLGRQRQLLSAVAGGAGLDELAAQVSATTGLTCRVLTASGRVVAGPPLPDGERDAVVRAHLTAERLPISVGRHTLHPVGPGTLRVTGWLVAAEGPLPGADAGREPGDRSTSGSRGGPGSTTGPDHGPTEDADTVAELAAIAALDRGRRRDAVAVARPIADDALARIAAGEGDRAETRVRLRQAGVEPDGGLTVVILRVTDVPDPGGIAHQLLTDALVGDGPAIVGVHDGSGVALLGTPDPGSASGQGAAPDTASDRAAAALSALRRLAPGLGTRRLSVGTGRQAGPDALSGAFSEAAHAAGIAAARPGPVAVARAGEMLSHVALLAGIPDDVRRGFAAQVLRPLLEHDARSGTELTDTLDAFLDESGSWSRTAARLHLHVNTVRYRIGRVEELTGRDLGRFADRVDLYLALRAR